MSCRKLDLAMSSATPMPPSIFARRKRKFRWAARLAGTAIILLLVIELALRLVLGLGNPVIYQPDPACGYLPVPNQHVTRFFCRNDINSFGLRCPEFTANKPPGTLRILFVGDSVTYGTTHVDQSKIFTSLL